MSMSAKERGIDIEILVLTLNDILAVDLGSPLALTKFLNGCNVSYKCSFGSFPLDFLGSF